MSEKEMNFQKTEIQFTLNTNSFTPLYIKGVWN